MAPNKGFKWRGLFSVLVFLATITGRHRAHSYSNHINIDDVDDDDVASTTTFITFQSLDTSSPLPPSTTTTDSPSSTISFEQHNGADGSEIPYQFNFSHPIYNASIPENSVQKTFVVQPYTDKARMGIQLFDDGVHSIDVKYQIVGGDKNKVFKAEERIVGDFAFLTIRTRTNNIVLNREKGDSYRLRVKATIARSRLGTKKRSVDEAETIVDVKVLDKNDLSPLFYPTKYSITVTDDTPLHQSILRVTAEDADIGINGGELIFLFSPFYVLCERT
jgi:protocadherin Fat 1/2/3